MTKTSRQKHKCLENEMNFQDEIKSTFHHFYRAFIEPSKTLGFDFKCGRDTIQKSKKYRASFT